jgi:hypothetical protein
VSAAEAIKRARAAGLWLGLDGNDIVLEAPKPPPQAILDLLARNKASIMEMLRPAKDGERHFEQPANRLAPHAWAEVLARLDPALPPGDVPPKQWRQFIDDCGRFLDKGWAARAEELGWGPLELFGCDRAKPFARIDRAGLLWFLNGGKLVALTAGTAAIETIGGTPQTYRRRSVEVDAVALAWELAL